VGQDAPSDDPDGRDAVRTARGVAALGYRAIGDVRVGADQVVRVDVAEGQPAVSGEAGADADLGGAAADGLERLLERQDETNRATGTERHERQQRLVFRVLLATEPATRIGRQDPHLGQRSSSSEAMTRWSQFGCWIALQTAIPSPSGAAM
jgi:hypothetical protein